MFRIETQSKLQLRGPEFTCDKSIHKQVEPPLPTFPFFMPIIGSTGSGKTRMMVNLLTSTHAYKKPFHTVHIVMPCHSVASFKKNLFKNHPRTHDELAWSVLDDILESVRSDAEKKSNSLLILDDVTASLKY